MSRECPTIFDCRYLADRETLRCARPWRMYWKYGWKVCLARFLLGMFRCKDSRPRASYDTPPPCEDRTYTWECDPLLDEANNRRLGCGVVLTLAALAFFGIILVLADMVDGL